MVSLCDIPIHTLAGEPAILAAVEASLLIA
jgi:hypothetical protein